MHSLADFLRDVYTASGFDLAYASFRDMYLGFAAFALTQTSSKSVPPGKRAQWKKDLQLPQQLEDLTAEDISRHAQVYTKSEVEKYGLLSYKSKVYDLREWIPNHPGDKAFHSIANWRGKDITTAFGLIHPGKAVELEAYYIGVLHTEAFSPLRDAEADMRAMLAPFVSSALSGVHNISAFHHPKCGAAALLGSSLGDLDQLLERLRTSRYINIQRPHESPILRVLKYGSPMHGVLDSDVLLAWIRSLS